MIERLSARNLNHLVVLAVLLDETNVSRAAKRLGLSQSATSHALASLRREFGDELLVRTNRGMVPTEYGARLRPELKAALSELSHALMSPARFDAKSSVLSFTVATADFLAAALGRELAHQFGKKMPNGSLRIEAVRLETLAERLLGGGVDVALAPPVPLDPGIQSEVILQQPWATALSAEHPLLAQRSRKAPLDVTEFVALEHVVVAPVRRGTSVVDERLEALGYRRRIRARFDSFSSAASALVGSRLVLTAPRVVFRDFGRKVRLFEPPVEIPPLALALHVDRARAAAAELRWLTTEVRRAVASIAR